MPTTVLAADPDHQAHAVAAMEQLYKNRARSSGSILYKRLHRLDPGEEKDNCMAGGRALALAGGRLLASRPGGLLGRDRSSVRARPPL